MRVLTTYWTSVPAVMLALGAVALVHHSGAFITQMGTLFLTTYTSASPGMIGKLIFFSGIGSMLGIWFGGRLSDGLGPDRAMAAGFALTLGSCCLALILIARTGILIGYTATLFLVAFSFGMFRPAFNASILDKVSSGDRQSSYAVFMVTANIGLAFSALIGALLIEHGVVEFFLSGACLAVCAALILYYAGRRQGKTVPAIREDGADRSDMLPSNAFPPFQDRPFLIICLIYFIVNLADMQSITMVHIYLVDQFGFSPRIIGYYMAASSLGIALFSLPVVSWTKNFHPRAVIAVNGFGLCVSMIILLFGTGYGIAALFWTVHTFSTMAFYPALMATAMSRAAEGRPGQYLSVYYMMSSIAGFTAPPLGGFIYQTFSPTILFAACGGVGLLVAAIALIFVGRTASAGHEQMGTG